MTVSCSIMAESITLVGSTSNNVVEFCSRAQKFQVSGDQGSRLSVLPVLVRGTGVIERPSGSIVRLSFVRS